jgi:hypothetical protein
METSWSCDSEVLHIIWKDPGTTLGLETGTISDGSLGFHQRLQVNAGILLNIGVPKGGGVFPYPRNFEGLTKLHLIAN